MQGPDPFDPLRALIGVGKRGPTPTGSKVPADRRIAYDTFRHSSS